MYPTLTIREGASDELIALGQLLCRVYSGLDGFPTPAEQPEYYELLANVGQFAEKPGVRLLIAIASDNSLAGGVVYFGDMSQYGSGGLATSLRDASGIRLLGVDPAFRGRGVGRALTQACIELARTQNHSSVVLHTTEAMKVAWGLYERLGFTRSPELDFLQQSLPVFGFKLAL